MPSPNTAEMRRALEKHLRAFDHVPWWRRLARRWCGHNAEDYARARVIERRIARADKWLRRATGK